MKRINLLVIPFLFTSLTQAQLLTVARNSHLTILNGTMFKVDSFLLTPSANFIISNNTLSKSTTVIHFTPNCFISRVYQFNDNTNPFIGSVQINYIYGAELNGIPENLQTFSIYNGSNWVPFSATTWDAVKNFVLTDWVSSVPNQLTLACQLTPLPLTWLSFTATKQNQTALLPWAATQEQNTRNFSVQHSANGINWVGISLLMATGNSTSKYSFVHSNPITGINYYRILQTDIDNKNTYGYIAIRTLKFTKTDEPFIIIGNLVTKYVLTVQVNMASNLALYTDEAKLLW